MTQERLTMRKIAEVLRLKWECQLSNRAIARSCSISHSTVSRVSTTCPGSRSELAAPRRHGRGYVV